MPIAVAKARVQQPASINQRHRRRLQCNSSLAKCSGKFAFFAVFDFPFCLFSSPFLWLFPRLQNAKLCARKLLFRLAISLASISLLPAPCTLPVLVAGHQLCQPVKLVAVALDVAAVTEYSRYCYCHRTGTGRNRA